MKSKSNAKPIVVTIVSIAVILIATFLIVWIAQNWNKLEQGVSGTNLYTYEDLTNAYEDGYNSALKNEQTYINQITEMKNNIDSLSSKHKTLESENLELKETLNNVQLENESYLNNNIKYLELIAYYEKYINEIGQGNMCTVSLLMENKVYDFITQEKGSKIAPPTPESTEYVRFNYWELNGERIDFNNYTLTESITLTANLTYFYNVNFINENSILTTQIVEEKTSPILPEVTPSKAYWIFAGYSLEENGEIANLSDLKITGNTNLYAVYVGDINGTYHFNCHYNILADEMNVKFTISNNELTSMTAIHIPKVGKLFDTCVEHDVQVNKISDYVYSVCLVNNPVASTIPDTHYYHHFCHYLKFDSKTNSWSFYSNEACTDKSTDEITIDRVM